MYSARVVLDAVARGETPGLRISRLDGIRHGGAVEDLIVDAVGSWPAWDAKRADKTLATLGWRRTGRWTGGGGKWYAHIERARAVDSLD